MGYLKYNNAEGGTLLDAIRLDRFLHRVCNKAVAF